MNPIKFLRILLAIAMMTMGPNVFAIDTSIATLELSGNVPAVFSVTARGLPGDLDLTPGVIVNDRLIGILHFKYNQDIDTLSIGSSTASGMPEDATGAYDFNTAFTVSIPDACFSTIAGTTAHALAAMPGTDVVSAEAQDLANNGNSGIIEDCNLTASWGGTAATLPLAGVYSMTITVTMVSQ